jgi:hypothetical protein
VALAPSNFGKFSNDLLVGNFGDSHISAFDPASGAFLGQLADAQGHPLTLLGGFEGSSTKGLWGLRFGNGGRSGPTNTLFFASGINDEMDGLFGALTVNSVSTASASSVVGVSKEQEHAPPDNDDDDQDTDDDMGKDDHDDNDTDEDMGRGDDKDANSAPPAPVATTTHEDQNDQTPTTPVAPVTSGNQGQQTSTPSGYTGDSGNPPNDHGSHHGRHGKTGSDANPNKKTQHGHVHAVLVADHHRRG